MYDLKIKGLKVKLYGHIFRLLKAYLTLLQATLKWIPTVKPGSFKLWVRHYISIGSLG